MKNLYLYLDDKRIPKDSKWIIAKNYKKFVDIVNKEGLGNFNVISLDHDLADFQKIPNYKEFIEKTGMDCAKFLLDKSMDDNISLPQIYVHSDNTVGVENIVSIINNYLKFNKLDETCKRVKIPHNVS